MSTAKAELDAPTGLGSSAWLGLPLFCSFFENVIGFLSKSGEVLLWLLTFVRHDRSRRAGQSIRQDHRTRGLAKAATPPKRNAVIPIPSQFLGGIVEDFIGRRVIHLHAGVLPQKLARHKTRVLKNL